MERKTPSKYRNRSQAAVSQQAPHRASGPGIAKPLRQTGRGPAQSRAVPTAGTPNALAWCLQDATSPKPAGRRQRAGKLSLEHQRGWERLRRPMGIREQPQFLRSFLPKTDFIARLQLPPCCPHAGDQPLQHQRALYRPRQRECCWGHGLTARVSRGTRPHHQKRDRSCPTSAISTQKPRSEGLLHGWVRPDPSQGTPSASPAMSPGHSAVSKQPTLQDCHETS